VYPVCVVEIFETLVTNFSELDGDKLLFFDELKAVIDLPKISRFCSIFLGGLGGKTCRTIVHYEFFILLL
jgi:hypothetical protein